MAQLPLNTGIPRFKQNEERMDRFINGSDSQTFTTSGGIDVPTIRKFLKDKGIDFDAAIPVLFENAAAGLIQSVTDEADRAMEEADRSDREADRADAEADRAAGYVNDIVSEKEVPIFSTIAGMSAIDVDLGMTRIRVDGRNSDIDGEGGLFSTTDTGSADTFVSADGRTWYRVNDDRDVAYLRLTNKKLLARAHYALTNALAFSLVCQGDSMTYGHDTTSGDVLPPPEGHTETRAPIQYPSRLATQLAEMTEAGVTVLNRGYSGDTAKVSYQRWPTRPNVDVVILSLGINDSGGLHGATFPEYQLYMERLVQRYIRWGIGVVIMTPTEIQHNNSQRAHADFGRYAAALGEAYGCPVIHAAEATSNCVAGEIYSDTIHFNKVGYAKLGDYVASAFLAGILSGNDRAVSSETFVHSVAGTPAVGFVHKGSIAPITTENAYIETDTALGIFDGARVTFAFYLDAEAADIFVAGDVTGAYFACSEPVDGKGTARTQIKGLRQSLVRETGVYQAQARLTGRKFYAGTFVGRGWKKFSITGPIGTNSTFLNGVWIVPKGEDEAGSQLAGYAPCKSDSFTHRVPDDGGGLLPAASINGDVVMSLPKALWVNASSADIFHATGVVHVTLIARGTPGNVNIGTRYLELVRYDGSNNLNVRSKDGSHETVPMPIAAGVGYTLPDQGPELLNKTRYPSQNENGWLYLTFADEVDGYYTFEVTSLAPHGASASLL